MTFTNDEIMEMTVRHDSDYWNFPCENDRTCRITIYVSNRLVEKACLFTGLYYADVMKNGWVDTYAYINVKRKIVTGIFFKIEPHNSNCDIEDKELYIRITNTLEGKQIYSQLDLSDDMKSENGQSDFDSYIDSCYKEYIKE